MTIIFDFDGTLHNTEKLYACAFRKAYRMLVTEGYAQERTFSDKEISQWLGVNAPDMWHSFMPDLPEKMMHKASMMIGGEMIFGVQNGQAVLYDGIREMLSQLRQKGCRLLILSNCRHAYMDAHRKALGLDRWFDGYFCAEDYGFIPKEDIFPILKEQFPDDVYIMVGDRASDIRVGLKNHIQTIGCLYGFAAEHELDAADVRIGSPADLWQAVLRLSGGRR